MPRYKLTIEYDGTDFVGWQVQDNGLSVQGVLADAVLAFAGERAAIGGAGRTDAGVHALGQVAHVDLAKDWPPDTVRDALNAHLRPDRQVDLVAIVRQVADGLQTLARDRGVEVKLTVRPGPLTVLGDRDEMLRQLTREIGRCVKLKSTRVP